MAWPLPLLSGDVGDLIAQVRRATDPAVEVLWPGPPIVFVGAPVDRADESRLREVAANVDWPPSRVLEALVEGPVGPPLNAELGATNSWRSVGPLPLTLDASMSVVRGALSHRSDLMQCRCPVALEIVHHQPRRGWWAIEVSQRTDTGHVLDVAKVMEVLGYALHNAGPPRR